MKEEAQKIQDYLDVTVSSDPAELVDRINDRNPDLIAEVIDEIEAEENQRKHKKEVNPYVEFPLDTDCFGNCFSDADTGL